MSPLKSRSWRRADYPNRKPAWQKRRIKDPLRNYTKVRGITTSKLKAKGTARGLKVLGKKTKIIENNGYYDIYYQ